MKSLSSSHILKSQKEGERDREWAEERLLGRRRKERKSLFIHLHAYFGSPTTEETVSEH
jgi:hypothetical protein